MIKKIHYIWLGGKKKPQVVKRCIKSWKKYMPDWEVIEWNENNLNIDICRYCRQAYDAKKYAFASDVLRFDVLMKEGGLYFDTDVKLLKSMQPLIDKGEAFTGYELNGNVSPGLVLYSPEPGNDIISKVLKNYNQMSFIKEDGSYNLRVVGEYFTDVIKEYGTLNSRVSGLFGSFRVYEATYFSPRDSYRAILDYSENTYSEHLFAASWLPMKMKLPVFIRRVFYYLLRPGGMRKCKELLRKIGINRN